MEQPTPAKQGDSIRTQRSGWRMTSRGAPEATRQAPPIPTNQFAEKRDATQTGHAPPSDKASQQERWNPPGTQQAPNRLHPPLPTTLPNSVTQKGTPAWVGTPGLWVTGVLGYRIALYQTIAPTCVPCSTLPIMSLLVCAVGLRLLLPPFSQRLSRLRSKAF